MTIKISPLFNDDLEKDIQNEDVRRLQQLLNSDSDTLIAKTGPGSPENETDYYGPATENAVMRFQLKYSIIKNQSDPGSGRVGPKTREVFKRIFESSVPTIQQTTSNQFLQSPPPQSKCFEAYGDFRISDWKKENIVKCDFNHLRSSFEHVVIGWEPAMKALAHENWTGFYCHKLVAPHFQAAFQNISDKNLFNQLKTFDGCLADPPRQMRSGNKWSMHSWGIAIDLNAKENSMGNEKFEMSEELAKCFEDAGFIWGGRWKGKFADAMHFQYAIVD